MESLGTSASTLDEVIAGVWLVSVVMDIATDGFSACVPWQICAWTYKLLNWDDLALVLVLVQQ